MPSSTALSCRWTGRNRRRGALSSRWQPAAAAALSVLLVAAGTAPVRAETTTGVAPSSLAVQSAAPADSTATDSNNKRSSLTFTTLRIGPADQQSAPGERQRVAGPHSGSSSNFRWQHRNSGSSIRSVIATNAGRSGTTVRGTDVSAGREAASTSDSGASHDDLADGLASACEPVVAPSDAVGVPGSQRPLATIRIVAPVGSDQVENDLIDRLTAMLASKSDAQTNARSTSETQPAVASEQAAIPGESVPSLAPRASVLTIVPRGTAQGGSDLMDNLTAMYARRSGSHAKTGASESGNGHAAGATPAERQQMECLAKSLASPAETPSRKSTLTIMPVTAGGDPQITGDSQGASGPQARDDLTDKLATMRASSPRTVSGTAPDPYKSVANALSDLRPSVVAQAPTPATRFASSDGSLPTAAVATRPTVENPAPATSEAEAALADARSTGERFEQLKALPWLSGGDHQDEAGDATDHVAAPVSAQATGANATDESRSTLRIVASAEKPSTRAPATNSAPSAQVPDDEVAALNAVPPPAMAQASQGNRPESNAPVETQAEEPEPTPVSDERFAETSDGDWIRGTYENNPPAPHESAPVLSSDTLLDATRLQQLLSGQPVAIPGAPAGASPGQTYVVLVVPSRGAQGISVQRPTYSQPFAAATPTEFSPVGTQSGPAADRYSSANPVPTADAPVRPESDDAARIPIVAPPIATAVNTIVAQPVSPPENQAEAAQPFYATEEPIISPHWPADAGAPAMLSAAAADTTPQPSTFNTGYGPQLLVFEGGHARLALQPAGPESAPPASGKAADDILPAPPEDDPAGAAQPNTRAGEPGAAADTLAGAERLGDEPVNNRLQFLSRETVLLDPGEWQFDIGLVYSYQQNDIPVALLDAMGDIASVIEGQIRQRELFIPFAARYGLSERTQLFIDVPVGWANTELSWNGSDEFDNDGGFGDITFGASFLAATDECRDVVFTFGVTAPTGDDPFGVTGTALPTATLGEGFWVFSGELLFIQTYDPVVLFTSIGTQQSVQREFNDLEILPGGEYFWTFGVGLAVSPRVTLSTRFIAGYVSETTIDSERVPGTIQEPMAVRMAATIAQKDYFVEPFVQFGTTDDANDSVFGVVWTY